MDKIYFYLLLFYLFIFLFNLFSIQFIFNLFLLVALQHLLYPDLSFMLFIFFFIIFQSFSCNNFFQFSYSIYFIFLWHISIFNWFKFIIIHFLFFTFYFLLFRHFDPNDSGSVHSGEFIWAFFNRKYGEERKCFFLSLLCFFILKIDIFIGIIQILKEIIIFCNFICFEMIKLIFYMEIVSVIFLLLFVFMSTMKLCFGQWKTNSYFYFQNHFYFLF